MKTNEFSRCKMQFGQHFILSHHERNENAIHYIMMTTVISIYYTYFGVITS